MIEISKNAWQMPGAIKNETDIKRRKDTSMDAVVHFEIPVDNMARAKKFYKEIFGWELYDMPGDMGYTVVHTAPTDEKNMLKEPGAINGGLTNRTEKNEASVVVINVPSIEDYIKKIAKAGGKVVRPKVKVMDMGYYARVTDSEGNVIGIWENIMK